MIKTSQSRSPFSRADFQSSLSTGTRKNKTSFWFSMFLVSEPFMNAKNLNSKIPSWFFYFFIDMIDRSNPLQVLLEKGILKICSKFTGEHPCRSVISIKSQSNFIEITFWHGYPPVNLQHIFRTPFLKNYLGELLLDWYYLGL